MLIFRRSKLYFYSIWYRHSVSGRAGRRRKRVLFKYLLSLPRKKREEYEEKRKIDKKICTAAHRNNNL
jgi:hypothetical protein